MQQIVQFELLEVIDLQNNFVLKRRFSEMPSVPWVADMISLSTCCLLMNLGFSIYFQSAIFFVLVAHNYRCEQTFSSMKIIKSKNLSNIR